MSNDTDYNLTFSHSDPDYLRAVISYLETKKSRWDAAKEEGKSAADLAAELGFSDTREVTTWGFYFGKMQCSIPVNTWANENSINRAISGYRGELASLLEKFPDLNITGSYRDEYNYGSIEGSEKCEQGSIGDDGDSECQYFITESVARKYLAGGDWGLIGESTEISDIAAAVLAEYQGLMLELNVTKLTDASAAALAKHEGVCICLHGLTKLTDAAAEALANYKGYLGLAGLTELSDAAAEALSKHQGGYLGLDGLTELSDAAVKTLSKYQGILSLGGLTELSDAAAKAISKHQESLSLNGLTELSDAAAEALSKHQGSLSLNGLTELSDAAAEALSKHQGQINLKDPAEWVASLQNKDKN